MLPVRALIFDLDGTLADSLDDIADAMNSTLAAHQLATHPREAYKRMVGDGIEHLVMRAVPRDCALPVQQLVTEYRSLYKATDHAKTQPYAGVAELLDGLERLGVRKAVLSNKRDDFTKALVAQRFGRWRFEVVLGERVNVPRKPDPTAALEIAAMLKLEPREVGFVGDTHIDMQTARAAGMTAIGVLWGFREKDELLAAGAQHLLSHPTELLSLR